MNQKSILISEKIEIFVLIEQIIGLVNFAFKKAEIIKQKTKSRKRYSFIFLLLIFLINQRFIN